MQIHLAQFEQYIDSTILNRGLHYFKNGYVHDPQEIRDGEYEAIVNGTFDYTVHITLNNNIVTEYTCDCPYDLGPICKHVVAVLFHLQQEVSELNKNTKKAKAAQHPKLSKPKPLIDQVDEILKKASHYELKQFIHQQISINPEFRNLFFFSFAQYNSDDSKEYYVKQIKSILKSASDRNGFIDWAGARILNDSITKVFEAAQNQIANCNYKSALFICTAIIEQITETLEYSDDSSGEVSDNIYPALEMLYRIAQKQLPEEIRKLLIDYCFSSFKSEIFSNLGLNIKFLHIAGLLIKTEKEADIIIKQINKEQESNYKKEELQNILYEVLLKTKDENTAEKYLEQNITNPALRRKAIQKAINTKNFEKAISLAKDGIQYNLKDKPGLVNEWYEYLLHIAQAQNDSKKIIEYARFLLIEGFRNEQDYYHILKQHIKPEDWNNFIESIIQEITNKNRWINVELIADIFIQEKWWNRLFELVKKTADFYSLDHYEKYLSNLYSNELAELYIQGIIKFMETHTGRNYYQDVCKYIQKIKKFGENEKALEVISYLRAEYPNRKALLDELNKVGL